jgi:hypothetical protein
MKIRPIAIIGIVALAILLAAGFSLNGHLNTYPEFAKLGTPRELEPHEEFAGADDSLPGQDSDSRYQVAKSRCLSWELNAPKAKTDAALKEFFRRHPQWTESGSGSSSGYSVAANGQRITSSDDSRYYINAETDDQLTLRTVMHNGRITHRTLTVYRADQSRRFWQRVREWFRGTFHV